MFLSALNYVYIKQILKDSALNRHGQPRTNKTRKTLRYEKWPQTAKM